MYDDNSPIAEASRLAARYLDLLVLHRLGHAGHIRNRTKITGWNGETEVVPWAG